MALLRHAQSSHGKLLLLSRPSLRLPPLHPAARGRVQKLPVACPREPAPILDQTAPCIIPSSSPGSGRLWRPAWALERRFGAGLHSANNHQCTLSQTLVLSQPQFPWGSSGVTAPLPQGPGCSRAGGVNRPAEGGLRAGPVLQPSVHRPPRRPPGRSCLLVRLPRPGPSQPARQNLNGGRQLPEDRARGQGQLLSYGWRTAQAWRAAGRDRPAPPGRASGGLRGPAPWPGLALPPGGAIAKRLLPSGGGVRAAAARSGKAGSGTPPSGAPRSPSRETHPGSPTPLPAGAAPIPQAERQRLESQERQCGAVVGVWALMPAPDCGAL